MFKKYTEIDLETINTEALRKKAKEFLGVEVKDPVGPYGAKGLGERGLVPTAAAVANALCDFDGVRRFSLPMNKLD